MASARSLKARARWLLTGFFALSVLVLWDEVPSEGASEAEVRQVARCELTGTVDSGSAAYLHDCVTQAEQAGDEALLIRLDTPGGALDSTRQIVGAFLGSRVPILVWVGPGGAHAGSAGMFITIAAHVAGMAPGTNIGAAHPVEGVSGSDPESMGKQMARKVENDTVAFAESIAHQRGRNESWAMEAVRESASLSADNAVKSKVVDFIAATESEMLSLSDGRKVKLPNGEHVLQTRGATLHRFVPTLGQRLVHLLASPALAYLLFLLGGLGIAIEFYHPGGIVPGLVGFACLILALIAFSALPVRIGAVVLLVLGFVLLAAELFVGHGVLALGGAVLIALGGILLVDRVNPRWFVEPSFGVPLSWVLPMAALVAGAAAFLVTRVAQARKMPQRGGDIGLVGELGTALAPVSPQGGEVFVHGERWRATSDRPIAEGARVVVRSVSGLLLHVEEGKPDGPDGSSGDSDSSGNSVRPVHLGRSDSQ
jgi:membrane-bound serine protease (ClpP class)